MIQIARGLLIVVSQGQSRSPEKRTLEEGIANAASILPNTFSLVVPHLYDLQKESESYSKVRLWEGPIVVLSWLFDRAAFWILDRMEVRGNFGEVELLNPDTLLDQEDSEEEEPNTRKERGGFRVSPPNRSIYSIDLRASTNVEDFIKEFERILEAEGLAEHSSRETLTLERFFNPTNDTALAIGNEGKLLQGAEASSEELGKPVRVDEHPSRRWYPVIDYSRCTNCMECIDFCLFGVYGVDHGETILVEQPDNCRKGCPACSRVCPENAIIFPQHKSPAIAGAPVESGASFKIDLSKLFGAPDRNEDAATAAARERDEQLILAGRAAVGAASSARKADSPVADKKKDELDSLIDELDSLDL